MTVILRAMFLVGISFAVVSCSSGHGQVHAGFVTASDTFDGGYDDGFDDGVNDGFGDGDCSGCPDLCP